MKYVLLGVILYALSLLWIGVIVPWLEEQMREFDRHQREQEEKRKPKVPRIPPWIRNGLALIRSANAANIVDNIISVQPMTTKVGTIHYLDVMHRDTPHTTPRRIVVPENIRRQQEALAAEVRRYLASLSPLGFSVGDRTVMRRAWGPDVENELVRRGLASLQYEQDREVRIQLLVDSAVEVGFAGWEMRERYAKVPAGPVCMCLPHERCDFCDPGWA